MNALLRIAVVGDFDESFVPHRATNDAIEHAATYLGVGVDVCWLPTEPLADDLGGLQVAHGLWCAPGSPYRSLHGALMALRYAREQEMPTLGTCGGCQHIILEYARHVLGFEDAGHAEYDPYASRLFISELACSLAGQSMSVTLSPGSQAADLYGVTDAEEEYYCNFGLNPQHQRALDDGGLRVTGSDSAGEARVFELSAHPFYIATLFVPQTRSTPGRPHPLVVGLLRATLEGARVQPRSAQTQ